MELRPKAFCIQSAFYLSSNSGCFSKVEHSISTVIISWWAVKKKCIILTLYTIISQNIVCFNVQILLKKIILVKELQAF